MSLVRLAQELGYETVVVDGRPAFATRERFPDVDRLVIGWPDEVADELERAQNQSTAMEARARAAVARLQELNESGAAAPAASLDAEEAETLADTGAGEVPSVGGLLNILLNLFLIPAYGAMGAVVATLVSYWFAVHGTCFLFRPLRQNGSMMTRAILWPKFW